MLAIGQQSSIASLAEPQGLGTGDTPAQPVGQKS